MGMMTYGAFIAVDSSTVSEYLPVAADPISSGIIEKMMDPAHTNPNGLISPPVSDRNASRP
jgi:hypothetical protein